MTTLLLILGGNRHECILPQEKQVPEECLCSSWRMAKCFSHLLELPRAACHLQLGFADAASTYPRYQGVFCFLWPCLLKFTRAFLLVKGFSPAPPPTHPMKAALALNMILAFLSESRERALHGLDSERVFFFLCLTAKFTSLFKLSEPVCNSSSGLLFLARPCADKSRRLLRCICVKLCYKSAKIMLLPVIQACSRAQAAVVVLSRTFLVVDTSNCKLCPLTTRDAPESAWPGLFPKDARGCLEIISSLVGIALLLLQILKGRNWCRHIWGSLFAVRQSGILRWKKCMYVWCLDIREHLWGFHPAQGLLQTLCYCQFFLSFPV